MLKDKKLSLDKRLAALEFKRQEGLKIPEVTEAMVTDVVQSTHEIFDSTNPAELKVALAHFIDRIDLRGREVQIGYSFDPETTLAVHWRPRAVDGEKLMTFKTSLTMHGEILARMLP